jgi:transcriptional regulator with XRE-family HTH domain
MTNQELGKALTQARIARGLTLHDVERDTRISLKYLQALEGGEIEVLPAPVYARAFMRTYAQYLGLNAASLVQHLPGAKPEVELPPLPAVGREATTPLVSASWLVPVVIAALLLGIGLLLFWNRGGEGGQTVTNEPPAATETVGQGSDQPATPTDQPPIIAVEPGVVPDLEGANLFFAIDALNRAGLAYLVAQVDDANTESGTVLRQSPSAESPANDDTVVSLVVSR